MKRFFAALLAVMLVFSLCITASAENASMANHSFKAYQIFKGTEVSGVGLTKIELGDGVASDFISKLAASEDFGETNPFASCTTAVDVADALTADNAEAFAKFAYANKVGNGTAVVSGTTELAQGYYLIVDTTTFGESATNTVYNLALLDQTASGKVDIESKVDIPTVQKKVMDANDSDTADQTSGKWQDSADYDFGDYVPFRLTATLGDISGYDTYKVVFHDTQDPGFGAPVLTKTGDIEGLKVYVGEGDARIDVTQQFHAALVDGGNDFIVSCDNVKAASVGAESGSVITVEYYAQLLTSATVGKDGNWNKVYLEYSNDVNGSGSTGKTPEDQVVVYTYDLKFDKYSDRGTQLDGAKFTVSKWDTSLNEGEGGWKELGTFDANATENYLKGVDAGKYKIVESTVPAGYTAMTDQEIIIAATHTLEADTPALESLTVSGITGDLVKCDEATYDSNTGFAGTGTIELDVTNVKGSTLPETGGVGTTIFYAVGGVLVVAAVVLLLTKKRMSAEG